MQILKSVERHDERCGFGGGKKRNLIAVGLCEAERGGGSMPRAVFGGVARQRQRSVCGFVCKSRGFGGQIFPSENKEKAFSGVLKKRKEAI